MSVKTVRLGIIGCGLMGRESASVAARWCNLTDALPRPEIVAVCDSNPDRLTWFKDAVPTASTFTSDYRELLAAPGLDAVYCAVPHDLHERFYTDILKAGKHLLGEKPFGIDRASNAAILLEVSQHQDLTVRCSSEYPFFPGVQRIVQAWQNGELGKIIQVDVGYLHSSDLNPDKPINWKRMVAINGAYGCLGDLGPHTMHVPLRLGWKPESVYAQLTKIVAERPDGKGGRVPCETWDNATVHCNVKTAADAFPMTVKAWRIDPGEINTWYISVKGTTLSLRFSTAEPDVLWTMPYESGKPQMWRRECVNFAPAYPTITGGIFEFGFADGFLQMWAAYMDEVAGNRPRFGCVTPDETAECHAIFTAALESQETNQVVAVQYDQ
jgi:predicted dehydrogenase